MSDPALSSPLPEPPPARSWASEPPARRRRTGPIVGAVAAVVVLAGAAAFALTRGGTSAEAQPLALAFSEGQSETYSIHQTMDGQMDGGELLGSLPIVMDVTQVVTWEVVSIDDEGVATISLSTSEMSGTVNGVPIPQEQAQTPAIEFQVAPDGRIVSAGGLALGGAGQTQGFGFPGMGQLTPLLPDAGEAVAPGDTWTKEFAQEFPFGQGTIEYTATSTYERNEDVNGVEAAVIVTEMTVPLDFTLNFRDLLATFGEEAVGATGATGLEGFEKAKIVYGGEGSFTQTSWVDLGAKELLAMDSAGDFDITMAFAGIPGFEGEMAFTGTFTQRLERR